MKRRAVLTGLGALVAALAGGAAWKLRLFARHYPPTPYDDVLARLDDREWTAKFGPAAASALPRVTAAGAAAQLRRLLGSGSLAAAAKADAGADRLVEAGGWLVPRSVALMAVLAASAA